MSKYAMGCYLRYRRFPRRTHTGSLVSEKKPSRDCLETPNGLRFVVPRAHTRGRNGAIFGAPRYRGKRDPTRLDTFQTVSLGDRVNKGRCTGPRPSIYSQQGQSHSLQGVPQHSPPQAHPPQSQRLAFLFISTSSRHSPRPPVKLPFRCCPISSLTDRNTPRRSSSLPTATAGSSKDQCKRRFASGKTGQASLAASHTVMT